MKLSVALCTYNGENYIREQMDSIINQTHPIQEIVVCDDGSTDSTIEIIKEYQKKYPEINFKIHVNSINLGSIKNFEKTIELCTGEIIFLSDQDDRWVETKVEKYVKIFQEDKQVKGIFSNGYLIDDDGEVIQDNSLWKSAVFLYEEYPQPIDFRRVLIAGNVVTGATLAFKKEVVSQIIPIPLLNEMNGNSIHHDYWIAQILADTHSLYCYNEKLIYYRIHTNQQVGLVEQESLENTENWVRLFIPNNKKIKTFSNYKYMVNLYYKNYLFRKENFKIYENAKINNLELIALCKLAIKDLYKEMEEKFPIRYKLMHFFDTYTGKRKF